jgi:uncharacterized protein (TIGR00730 family)
MKIEKICIFCSSKTSVAETYTELARICGAKIASLKLDMVYGGTGFGLMQAASKAALDAGGKVIGIYPELLKGMEAISETLTEKIIVSTMYERKEAMINISDAFIILPGGIGTLDEFFEVLSLAILKQHNKPIILINHNHCWDSLNKLIKDVVDNKFASPALYDKFHTVETVEEAFKRIGF